MKSRHDTPLTPGIAPRTPQPPITPRKPAFDFSQVPKTWLGGSRGASHIANGINLLFPDGERYFVRSVNAFVDRITDPVLREQIKGFFGQEGRHAHAHDGMNQLLRDQGYEIDRFLDRYRRWGEQVDRIAPAKLKLAATAAAEHFTAIMADGAFTLGMLDAAHPVMRDLLGWHAAEEIEHKAVAYDVLQVVDPSYALRVAGLAMATLSMMYFWRAAATDLLRQDGMTWRDALRELRQIPQRSSIMRRVFARGIREYLRRDFHPNQRDNFHLAKEWFANHGAEAA